MARRKTSEETIKDFQNVHGNKYDYSKVNYKNNNTKIIIICPEHGEFLQTPNGHKNGAGCPKCGINKIKKILKKSLENVITDFKEVHGDKYNYSKVQYINTMTKVEILCPEHGSFFQSPNDHLRKIGCPKCAGRNQFTQKEVIKKFKEVHGDKYDYSKVRYKNLNSKINIICPEHGEFLQAPKYHIKGSGCPKCNIQNRLLTQYEAINNFKKVHGNKYDYSKVQYLHSMEKIEIICPKHGSFWQTPNTHSNMNCECPKCAQENSESKGERKVREFLEENNIKYSQEVKLFDNYRFDFYLEDLNTVIEYDGKQHFEPVDYFGGLEGFLKTQERDKIKTEYCLENNIRIIRIAYFEEVEEILKGLI